MDIALLNVKITVQKNTVTVDKIGNHKTNGRIITPAMPPPAMSRQVKTQMQVRLWTIQRLILPSVIASLFLLLIPQATV